MRTVKDVSALTGVSVRTLRYYDRIGLLRPEAVTEAGYRLYGDASLERLRHILLYRELGFSLREIGTILDAPDFDRGRALEQQARLLEMKAERLHSLAEFARGVQRMGVSTLDFTAFDSSRIDEYARQAKALYGNTDAYKEFERRSADRTEQQERDVGQGLMDVLARFGGMLDKDPACGEAQAQVRALQDYITAHYYTCTPQILSGLGQMYAAGGDMTDNIDKAGGSGTADFAARAIAIYTA
ncbi:MAG: MerR family transcriptional regulator [Candidatus Spyradocola sp.]